jgi:hypothetical protein
MKQCQKSFLRVGRNMASEKSPECGGEVDKEEAPEKRPSRDKLVKTLLEGQCGWVDRQKMKSEL